MKSSNNAYLFFLGMFLSVLSFGQSQQTSHFVYHFEPELSEQVQAIADRAEYYYPLVTQFLEHKPKKLIHVDITDQYDLANGFASTLYYPRMQLRLANPTSISLSHFTSFMDVLIVHELTHVIHLDKKAGVLKAGQKLFGTAPIFEGNALKPSWMIEGLAVYIESTQKQGRGHQPYYETIMRQQYHSGWLSLQTLNANISQWPFSRNYLYGYYFYHYLLENYGQQAIKDWVDVTSASPWYFISDAQSLKPVTGRSLNHEWPLFHRWLDMQYANEAPLKDLATSLPSAHTGNWLESGNEYVWLQSDGKTPLSLMSSNGLISNKMSQTVSMTSLTGNKLLVNQVEGCQSNANRISTTLYQVENKKLTRLNKLKCSRWLSAAPYDEQSIIGIVQRKGQTSLQIWQLQSGKVNDILSVDGLLSIIKHPFKKQWVVQFHKEGAWQLGMLNKASGQWSIQDITLPGFNAFSPTFDEHGKLYSTLADKTSFNVYEIKDFNSPNPMAVQITTEPFGAFKPKVKNDNLLFETMNANGYEMKVVSLNENRNMVENKDVKNIHLSWSFGDFDPNQTATLLQPEDKKSWQYGLLGFHYWLPNVEYVNGQQFFGISSATNNVNQSNQMSVSLLGNQEGGVVGDLSFSINNRFVFASRFEYLDEKLQRYHQVTWLASQSTSANQKAYVDLSLSALGGTVDNQWLSANFGLNSLYAGYQSPFYSFGFNSNIYSEYSMANEQSVFSISHHQQLNPNFQWASQITAGEGFTIGPLGVQGFGMSPNKKAIFFAGSDGQKNLPNVWWLNEFSYKWLGKKVEKGFGPVYANRMWYSLYSQQELSQQMVNVGASANIDSRWFYRVPINIGLSVSRSQTWQFGLQIELAP